MSVEELALKFYPVEEDPSEEAKVSLSRRGFIDGVIKERTGVIALLNEKIDQNDGSKI
jgi:hypothetical protein